MTDHYAIGQFIHKQRKSVGLTQKELANQLFISPQAVSKWETGETLPDTSILLSLSDILNTTTDKILSGGNIITRKNKRINILNIVEGLKKLEGLKDDFGEKSTFYQGAIEGINKKMNIDFERYLHDEYYKEVMLSEIIIQYLIEGYTTEKSEVDLYIHSTKMRNIIYKYINEDSDIKLLFYADNPVLFDTIRKMNPAFSNIDHLNELPGEFLHLENGKNYWALEIDTDQGFCYGIAVDEKEIQVFTYGFGGENMKLVIKEKR